MEIDPLTLSLLSFLVGLIFQIFRMRATINGLRKAVKILIGVENLGKKGKEKELSDKDLRKLAEANIQRLEKLKKEHPERVDHAGHYVQY